MDCQEYNFNCYHSSPQENYFIVLNWEVCKFDLKGFVGSKFHCGLDIVSYWRRGIAPVLAVLSLGADYSLCAIISLHFCLKCYQSLKITSMLWSDGVASFDIQSSIIFIAVVPMSKAEILIVKESLLAESSSDMWVGI